MNNSKYLYFMMTLLALSPLWGWSQETAISDAPSYGVYESPVSVAIDDELYESADSVGAPVLIEEFDHDVESVVFIPKGQWVAGFSFNYSQSTQNDYQFLVLENLSGDTYSFKITPMLCYMLKDDLGVGVNFSYTRSLTKLATADFVLGADTQYDIEKLYRLSHNYYATVFMRNYFSLGNTRRFGFFSQLQCQLGGGQSKLMKGAGENLSGVYETNFSLDVGLTPGIIVFLNNYSAMEVNVGVLGFSYTHTKSVSDRIYRADRRSKFANFHINLFSITFGVSFYL